MEKLAALFLSGQDGKDDEKESPKKDPVIQPLDLHGIASRIKKIFEQEDSEGHASIKHSTHSIFFHRSIRVYVKTAVTCIPTSIDTKTCHKQAPFSSLMLTVETSCLLCSIYSIQFLLTYLPAYDIESLNHRWCAYVNAPCIAWYGLLTFSGVAV